MKITKKETAHVLRKHEEISNSCLTDCWLEVKMYPEGPVVGHLGRFLFFIFVSAFKRTLKKLPSFNFLPNVSKAQLPI